MSEGRLRDKLAGWISGNQENETKVTEKEELRSCYDDERLCIAFVNVDNLDEIISKSDDERKALVPIEIEAKIRNWAATLNASVIRVRRDLFQIIFEHRHFEEIKAAKFSLLDDVRQIPAAGDFPISVSIGVGMGGNSPAQTDEYADFALDLALGRGGDQAVVKDQNQVTYFGGKTEASGQRNKGKSRVMAHALRRLIAQSSSVLIMGHKNPDMDSLGAAVGIYRMAFAGGKDVRIVLGEYGHALQSAYEKASQSGSYIFVSAEEALEIVEPSSLLVVVDTHLAEIAACPELIGRTERLVVIDHHRRKESYIENATLTFMEPGASSTSELISEILQYDDDVKKLNKLDAELLLAGIIVDTNHFSVKAGARSFEAAAWLKGEGADSTAVRQLLQIDPEDFRLRASIIAGAEIGDDGIAYAIGDAVNENAQLVSAKAADELLDIKGLKASFVIGRTKEEVVISARAIGDLNVQLVMERLGGGGHLSAAAAQIKGGDVKKVLEQIKEIVSELKEN
jgi:c-di-AMP phosphodiesterase-like protein